MSLIKVERFLHLKDCEIARVYINGEHYCYSVEDSARTTKKQNQNCIPDGVYELGTTNSREIKISSIYKHEMLTINGIPEMENTLFHFGFLVSPTTHFFIIGDKIGMIKGKEGLLSSKATYFQFHRLIYDKVKEGNQKIEFTTI